MTKRSERPCPHCHKPAAQQGNPWRPFCSERCRTIDLGNWAMGQYRIPGERVSPAEMPAADEERK